MNSGTEAAEQIVRMSLNGVEVAARITGKAALRVAAFLYAIMKDQKKTRGKSKLNRMLKNNQKLSIFSINDGDVSRFCHEARRYGILYCILKDKNASDGKTDIMVRDSDKSKVSRIIERYHLYDYDISSVVSEKLPEEELNEIMSEIGDQLVRGKASVPEAPALEEKDPVDEYLEKVLSFEKDGSDGKPGNPTQARAVPSPQSGRSSGARKREPSSQRAADKASDEERDARKRPSVRKELEEIKKERAGKKPDPAKERAKPPKHRGSKKKRRKAR